MIVIPIFSDTLSQDELKKAIEQYNNEQVSLIVMDNPDKHRSSLSDPAILGAIIQAGGTLLAALIGVLAAIYANRKQANKTDVGGNIIINIHVKKDVDIQPSDSKVVIPLDNFQLEAHKDKILELELHPERIENISYVEES